MQSGCCNCLLRGCLVHNLRQAAAGEVASLRERLEGQEREAEELRATLRHREAQFREQADTIADLQHR